MDYELTKEEAFCLLSIHNNEKFIKKYNLYGMYQCLDNSNVYAPIICRLCNVEDNGENFYKNASSYPTKTCKVCYRKRQNERRKRRMELKKMLE